MPRILIADDHAILRAGLKLLIENQPDLQVVGEASDGNETLIKAESLQPDLILLDLNMPNLDGLQALPMLKQKLPQTHVLILTMHDDASYLREALQAGASGYVLKRVVDNELIIAIRAVLRGETYVHSAMTQKLMQNIMPSPTDTQEATKVGAKNPWEALSERESDVLRLVALGYTNAEVAEELFLSVKTVETYRARGMEKLDLHTRAQLVRLALKYNLLDE